MLRGAAVAPDIGKMARTPEVHDAFRPERFAALSPDVATLASKTRGSLRLDSVAGEPHAMQSPRNCTIWPAHTLCRFRPGRYFADMSFWLAAASMITRMDMSDSQGKRIIP